MLFAFLFSLVPLIVAAGSSAPHTHAKVAFNFKPESWMLKSLSPSDEHYKPPSKSVSSYVNEYTYWLATAYYSTTYCSNDEIIMKTAFPTGTCIPSDDPTNEFSSVTVYCYSGIKIRNFSLLLSIQPMYKHCSCSFFFSYRVHLLLLHVLRLVLWFLSEQFLRESEHVPGG